MIGSYWFLYMLRPTFSMLMSMTMVAARVGLHLQGNHRVKKLGGVARRVLAACLHINNDGQAMSLLSSYSQASKNVLTHLGKAHEAIDLGIRSSVM